jgi:hypothetical protein
MRAVTGIIFGVMLGIGLLSCNNDIISNSLINESSFTESQSGWQINVADYDTVIGKDSLKLTSQIAAFPSPLPISGKALLVRSNNYGPSLFTFLTKKITGLQPEQTYSVQLEADLITRFPRNDSAVFVVSPETALFLKSAVTNQAPEVKVNGSKIVLNLDKGALGLPGKDFKMLSENTFPTDTVYSMKQFKTANDFFTVTPDEQGNIWICIGTETAFKGQTVVYYERIKINIKEKETND